MVLHCSGVGVVATLSKNLDPWCAVALRIGAACDDLTPFVLRCSGLGVVAILSQFDTSAALLWW